MTRIRQEMLFAKFMYIYSFLYRCIMQGGDQYRTLLPDLLWKRA
jgi:hypothetical protein